MVDPELTISITKRSDGTPITRIFTNEEVSGGVIGLEIKQDNRRHDVHMLRFLFDWMERMEKKK